jgi:hypothetical protein
MNAVIEKSKESKIRPFGKDYGNQVLNDLMKSLKQNKNTAGQYNENFSGRPI